MVKQAGFTNFGSTELGQYWETALGDVFGQAPAGEYRKNCLGLLNDTVELYGLPVPDDAAELAQINAYGSYLIASDTSITQPEGEK